MHCRRALGKDERRWQLAVLGLGTCERKSGCAGILWLIRIEPEHLITRHTEAMTEPTSFCESKPTRKMSVVTALSLASAPTAAIAKTAAKAVI